MSFDTSWDVEQYKGEHECEEHWQFRRKFLIAHKTKYPENRLLSLAQIFFNVEFLGCSYPPKTMDLVENLSKGLADDLRENRKRKLQRTFVAASNVAQARAKEKVQTAVQMIDNSQPNNVKKFKSTPYDADYIMPGLMLLLQNDIERPLDILERSCIFSKISKPVYKFHINKKPYIITSDLFIEYKLIASGYGKSKKAAKKEAVQAALNILKEKCFIIYEKEDEESDLIAKPISIVNDNDSTSINTPVGSKNEINDEKNDTRLTEDNIGNKLLKMMGWEQGRGLGKNGQGRIDPIEVVQLPKNLGLGGSLTHDKSFASLKEIKVQVLNFLESSKRRLLFSTEFSKEERKIIHIYCLKYGLKTKSYGKGDNRYMVISKKPNAKELFEELINNDCKNDCYILQPPSSENVTC